MWEREAEEEEEGEPTSERNAGRERASVHICVKRDNEGPVSAQLKHSGSLCLRNERSSLNKSTLTPSSLSPLVFIAAASGSGLGEPTLASSFLPVLCYKSGKLYV